MIDKPLLRKPPKKRSHSDRRSKRKVLNKIVENDLIRRVSFEEYRDKVRDVYDGPQGALLATCSLLSLHLTFGERLIRERKFDVHGARQILDVGSGAGQIAKHLLKYADRGARLTCFDLSYSMLRRARSRLKSSLPDHLVADVTR
ncbi:MAG TPA: methyltransferase domain-containing protein, partial [Pirellulales bacterium]|nr:methyltransferase domain-containing protein [Pirellulales bacterium]